MSDKDWGLTRSLVFRRDEGICRVCQNAVDYSKEYECGHIVSKMFGGSDEESNLVVMCTACNRWNPEHKTRESFEAWVKDGYWKNVVRYQPGFQEWAELLPNLSWDEKFEFLRRRRNDKPRSWVDRKNQMFE